jgi:cytochrome c oxidase subunit 2
MNPATLQDMLQAAGPQAAHIGELWWLMLAVCAAVFVAVLAALFMALRRAPRSDPRTPADIASLSRDEPGPRRAVISAVALSTVLLVGLLVASVATDRALARLPLGDALHVEITAHQWWWDIRYDDPDPTRMFTTANEMHIPVGRPVIVTLKSDDVIHSFWVPNLHGKKDLIPGRTATIQLRADDPGTYRGQCAEFCGLQHALMAMVVIASPPQEYEAWAEGQRRAAPQPGDERQKRGQALFVSGSCMLCHAIGGTPAGARKGPDLTHLGSRKTLAAGTLPNTPQHLAAWILDPQKFKPGVNMPAHPLPAQDLDALVAYLGMLQ